MARGMTPDVAQYLLEKNGLDPQQDITLDYSFSHIDLANLGAAGGRTRRYFRTFGQCGYPKEQTGTCNF